MPFPFSAGEILTAANLNTALGEPHLTWSSPFAGGVNVSGGTFTQATYCQVGNIVVAQLDFVGSSTFITGAVSLTLPVTASGIRAVHGTAWFEDNGSSQRYAGHIRGLTNTTTCDVMYLSTLAVANTVTPAALSAGTPFTWASNDRIEVQLVYLAA